MLQLRGCNVPNYAPFAPFMTILRSMNVAQLTAAAGGGVGEIGGVEEEVRGRRCGGVGRRCVCGVGAVWGCWGVRELCGLYVLGSG